jgi:hypothetical protein
MLVFWKVSLMNADLAKKKDAIRMFTKEANKINEKQVEDLFGDWKDQKEGIGKLTSYINFISFPTKSDL